MRIIIIGGVAAGTSAAAKARRNKREAEIVLYEKDSHISYSGCGIPYYLGGELESAEDLTPRDPAFFKDKYDVDIFIGHEVLAIEPVAKTVTVKKLATGDIFSDHYDKLVLATGATAIIPAIKGTDQQHAFTIRTITDMNSIEAFIEKNRPHTAAIIGSGYVGLELCENLNRLGMDVTVLEKQPQVAPGLDEEMAVHVEDHIRDKGVSVLTGVIVAEITDSAVILEDGQQIAADLVIVSTGVRPRTELAAAAGVELGVEAAIRVNSRMQTSQPDIYACGDCTEQIHLVTGKPVYRPLGSTANKTGRIAGDTVTGGNMQFNGILGTGIFRIFDMTVAQTGLSEKEALEQGYQVVTSENESLNKTGYMGGQKITIKAVTDKSSGRLLGAQIVGFDGVDKRIDVLATAITCKATAEDLFHLDLAYAPPFSTVRDPVMYTGMILAKSIDKKD